MGHKIFLIGMITLGVASRLAPHLPNFTPLGALALFSGFYFKSKKYALLPLATMAISDFATSGYYGPVMFYVYGSFLLTFLIGKLLQKNLSPFRLLVLSLLSSCLFFTVTNFAVWLHGTMYTKDMPGLINCYVAAIPFLRMAILGDLFYSFVIFGSYYLSLGLNKNKALQKN